MEPASKEVALLFKTDCNVFKKLQAKLKPEVVVPLEVFFNMGVLRLGRERRSLCEWVLLFVFRQRAVVATHV